MFRIMILVLVFTCYVCVYGQITEDSELAENKKWIASYRDKICKSEKTCHLVDTVHESLRTLRERNCMCDAVCTVYGDCCEDSIYYNKYDEYHLQPFYCSTTERVYMKSSCPFDYPNQSMKSKCESSTAPLQDENRKLFVPVTNTVKNITYGNEYCAICNNEYTYQSWNLTSHCSLVYDPTPPANTENVESTTKTSSTFIDYYQLDKEQAQNSIRFNPKNKTFYSEVKGKLYECWYKRKIPDNLTPHLRDCVPVIANCTVKNYTLLELCESYTSIVYDEYKVAYKNKDCAYCNNITKNLTGCVNPQDTRITGSSIFTTNDKGSGNKPPCNDPRLKDKNFC